jgi:hypothetical protein
MISVLICSKTKTSKAKVLLIAFLPLHFFSVFLESISIRILHQNLDQHTLMLLKRRNIPHIFLFWPVDTIHAI